MKQSLDILEKLVAFPTVSSSSNLTMIAYLHDFLSQRGFDLHQIADSSGKKSGLFASLGPSGDGGILLSGHTDVVPTQGQHWTHPDFKLTVEGGRAYGRGTTDMKGYLACMLTAADAASKLTLKRPLKLAFSFDEEIGCVGIAQMIDHLVPNIGLPEMVIVGEPTSMQVAIGHKGKAAIRATCRGQNGHSALAPKFVNALHIATDFVSGLRELQNKLATSGARDEAYAIPYSTLHVGKLQGGIALNIVPDTATIDFEYRHLAADSGDELMAQITQLADRVAARYQKDFPGAAIELDRYNTYPGLDVSVEQPVVATVQHLAQTNTSTKVAFGTEAGYFDQLGIPTVVCGPGCMEEQGHKPDESIALDELAACDAMMQRVVQSLCI